MREGQVVTSHKTNFNKTRYISSFSSVQINSVSLESSLNTSKFCFQIINVPNILYNIDTIKNGVAVICANFVESYQVTLFVKLQTNLNVSSRTNNR